MRLAVLGVAVWCLSAASMADTIRFGPNGVGQPPAGWTCGATGRGKPKWTVEEDSGAPRGKVLRQSGSATFPWCVKSGTALSDGLVEARFKSLSGNEDQAGGVVWRWKDGDNYYVARANALENNVSLYYTARGIRRTLKSVDVPVAARQWHTLRVEFRGTSIGVSFDGNRYIDVIDDHIVGAGSVGVWTKADSVTAFAEFGYQSAPP